MLRGTPGAERAQERDCGRSQAQEDSSSHWLVQGLKMGGAWPQQAAHMAAHVICLTPIRSGRVLDPAPGLRSSSKCD